MHIRKLKTNVLSKAKWGGSMSKKISIAFVNADKIIRRFKHLEDIDKVEVIKKATEICHSQAKLLCPTSPHGGNLKESISMDFEENGANSVGKVYTNVEYAAFVEFGTGKVGEGSYEYANEIDKRYGIKLKYRQTPWVYTPDEGETFIRTSGQKAQPFMYPALKKSEDDMLDLMKKDFKSEINKKLK